jgi:co-chaperonin GroES (HSP10)
MVEGGQVNIRPLYGMMIVTRDADAGVYVSKDGKVVLHMPDNERIRAQSGLVHIHNAAGDWDGRVLDGRRILFSKYSEREFQLGGRMFCTVDERDVLAVFTRSESMEKKTFLEEVTKQLGLVEGEELSSSDLTAIAEEITAWAEDEIGVEEDDDEDVAEEKEEA